jgi:hypothetical protein
MHAQRVACRHVSRVRECIKHEVYATLVQQVLVAVERRNPMHSNERQALSGEYIHHTRTRGCGGEHLRHPQVNTRVRGNCARNGSEEGPVPLVYPAQNACNNSIIGYSSDALRVGSDVLRAREHGKLAEDVKRGADRHVEDTLGCAHEEVRRGRHGV